MNHNGEGGESGKTVRARLARMGRRRGIEFQLLLSEFAIERLLHRLGISVHSDRFVLKGATLFKLWSQGQTRATWDLDLHGWGESSVDGVVSMVRDLCVIPGDDGIGFDSESITGDEIRFLDHYSGIRVWLKARLATARIPMHIDVGFGDAIVPAPRRVDFPTLLDHEPPRILVYSREAVVAEKLETMISRGLTNSRMKDFYDIHLMASLFAFDAGLLIRAIRATFARRGTSIPTDEPRVMALDFLASPERSIQWRAFLRRCRLIATPDAKVLGERLRAFLLPLLRAAGQDLNYEASWNPGGSWKVESE